MTFTALLKDGEGAVTAANVTSAMFNSQKNLAAGKPVTVSTYWVDNPPSTRDFSGGSLVDGDLETRWAPLDGDANQSAMIDFEETVEIGSVVLYEWLDSYATKQYRSQSFKLSASQDGENWTEIYTGGQINEKLIAELQKPVKARYLKIHDFTLREGSNGNVSLYEVMVFAPEKQPAAALSITGELDATVDAESLTYVVTAEHAEKLATATLELKLDAAYLTDPVAEGRNGWYVLAQSYTDGLLHVVLANNEGMSGSGELLAVTAKTTGTVGSASVELTDAVLSAYTGETEAFVEAALGEAAVTKIDYSLYDVNQDGTVNQLDITRTQRAYGAVEGDTNWNARADVNRDGLVDINDLILIMNHYSK